MKRFSRFLLTLAATAGAVAAALWLLRERIAGPPIEPVRSHEEAPRLRTMAPRDHPHAAAAAPGPPGAAGAEPDDLTAVSGIGPVYRRRLAEIGITTFASLASADAPSTAEAVDAPQSFVEDWVRQAADLAG